MTALLWSRTTLIWLLLVAATTLSWEIGHGIGTLDARIGGAAILAVAFVKVRFVMFDFMEIRGRRFGCGESQTAGLSRSPCC